MRWFYGLLLLTLIALALHLNGTKSMTGASPRQAPTVAHSVPKTLRAQQRPDNYEGPPTQASGVLRKNQSTPQNHAPEAAHHTQPSPAISPVIVINNHDWIVGSATFVLAVVGVIQLFLLRATLKANKMNAEAATQNAIAATETLKSGRPYLLVEKGELKGFDISNEIRQARLTFKNFGKRPALIDRVLLRLDHVETGKYPAIGDFNKCTKKRGIVNAVGANESFDVVTDGRDVWETPLNMEDIREGKRVLICYGCLYYTDVIGGEARETGFLWYYLPHPPEFLKFAEVFGQPRKYKGRFVRAEAFNYNT